MGVKGFGTRVCEDLGGRPPWSESGLVGVRIEPERGEETGGSGR